MILCNKNVFRYVSIVMLLFTMQTAALAQTSLAVDKKGKVKRIHFYRGDIITIKIKEEKNNLTGFIEMIEDSAVIIEGRKINVNQIEYIINPQGPFIWRLLSQLGIKGAIIYFTLDTGNRVINNEKPIVDEKTLKVTLPFLVVGVVATLIKNKKYRNNGSNIKIVKL